MRIFLTLALLTLFTASAFAFEIPTQCRQLIIGTAPDWNSSEVILQRWERTGPTEWKPAGSPWKGRLGAQGLAWGIGLHPGSAYGPQKQEGDGRAPAGVFKIGKAYGYAASIIKNPSLQYHQVTERDLWVEDASSKYYNRHLQLENRAPITEWEQQAQMRLNDPAHALKLFIGHNSPPNAVAGAGSAIFFHIWRRDGDAPTSGCTVQDEKNLRTLIAWVDPDQFPLYVLLPRETYQIVSRDWQLP
jgi:L,D-peptidoglycan transpeptidase YkuD (ErfK/YbiS/YcfS/YnhG family)